mmetsp:Transcript_29880/g.68876  ORF Transcript_29880/g.68876 Transcript_29880/m.68876 type:complete len:209 (+) Transcript_29880:904-1530(+)
MRPRLSASDVLKPHCHLPPLCRTHRYSHSPSHSAQEGRITQAVKRHWVRTRRNQLLCLCFRPHHFSHSLSLCFALGLGLRDGLSSFSACRLGLRFGFALRLWRALCLGTCFSSNAIGGTRLARCTVFSLVRSLSRRRFLLHQALRVFAGVIYFIVLWTTCMSCWYLEPGLLCFSSAGVGERHLITFCQTVDTQVRIWIQLSMPGMCHR